jgi:hypothetical protein
MSPNTGVQTEVITPLQKDKARVFANKTPGSHTDPPGSLIPGEAFSDRRVDSLHDVTDPAVDIGSAGMLVNEVQQLTALSHVLFDTIPIEVNNQYLMFLDLDNNSSTGGSPSSLGFDTGFQGAELVTRVVVTFTPPPAITIASAGFRVVTPTVWKFQSGNLVEVSDSGIGAQVRTVREAETGEELFDVVSIHMPNSVRGPATAQARIQAIAEHLFAPGELDRLPDSPLSGGVPLFLVHPEFPLCGVDPAEVPQGSAASVEANGLIPGETAKVFLGDELVSTGLIDEQGNADISFAVPFTAPTPTASTRTTRAESRSLYLVSLALTSRISIQLP